MDGFCGGDWWKLCNDVQELLEKYMHKLEDKANELRKYPNFVDYIRVKGQGTSTMMFLICKKGPYIRAWLNLKRTLENLQLRCYSRRCRMYKNDELWSSIIRE